MERGVLQQSRKQRIKNNCLISRHYLGLRSIKSMIIDSTNKTTNYFNMDKQFFFIDSNNLDSVKTRFYGYSIQDTGIYEEDNLDEQAITGLDGCGCYIYVKAEKSEITIQQDFNGSYGIYSYRRGGVFCSK